MSRSHLAGFTGTSVTVMRTLLCAFFISLPTILLLESHQSPKGRVTVLSKPSEKWGARLAQ